MAYKARMERPEAGNPYYNTKANGGYSDAIKGNPTDAGCDVLANCVGYAYGRFNEIGGYGYCKYLRPVNAENFIQYKGSLTVGQTPKLGACMVWRKGNTLGGSDGAGHVAIVEQINSPTQIKTSESGYGSSSPFWTKTRNKGADGNWGAGAGYAFLGFIYNPAVSDEEEKQDEEKPAGEVSSYTRAWLQKMFDHLKKLGYSDAGIYGMLANANGESACKSNNLQNTGNSQLGMTDEQYTAAVDNGSYTNFAKDGHGYGLFQMTYHTRKAEMLAFCKTVAKSIGDCLMQLDFTDKELQENYKSLYKLLCSTTSIQEASNAFMLQYERPADQSEAAQAKRAAYGEQIKKLLEEAPVTETPDATEDPGTSVYTVKQGDTLFEIALRYGTTYQELAAYNGISNPHRIYVGQKIRIPGKASTESGTYAVVQGDTLWGIASRLLGDGNRYGEIKAMNGLTSNTIYEGQVLKIPEK